jgi:hypothetical protein
MPLSSHDQCTRCPSIAVSKSFERLERADIQSNRGASMHDASRGAASFAAWMRRGRLDALVFG